MMARATVVSADEAVKHIKSGANIAINGFGGIGYPDSLSAALEKRFLETGEPTGLSLWYAAGQGGRGTHLFSDRLAHEGLLRRVVGGHWDAVKELMALAAQNKIEAYNLPQGVISHLFRAAAGRKPAIITEIGLKTFIDPRMDGGKLNPLAKEDLVRVIEIDGKEYLMYKTPKLDACFIRGTTADPAGNITLEKEAAFLDVLTIAQATKANGGVVICQVERLSAAKAHPKMVKVPGVLVDFIVVAPDQKQTRIESHNPAYSGEIVLPRELVLEHNKKLEEMSAGITAERKLEDWAIARRAALELKPAAVVNLGIGIPSLIGAVAEQEAVSNQIVLTVESGTIGGVPAGGASFGAAMNPDVIYDQPAQFDFYDGGGLDVTFVGAAQIDKEGNVNVSKIGSRIIGVGGFINITQTAKKVVYCTTFTGGKGLKLAFEDGRLKIVSDGEIIKFTDKVSQVSFSGEYARDTRQEVIYVTERCVFRLTRAGLMLTEVAPGIDIEKDILAKMKFRPLVAENLQVMDARFFAGGSLGLKDLWK